jgi:hypothetical protein
MSSLSGLLLKERAIYLDGCQEDGGTAEGFRQHILQARKQDPQQFDKRTIELLMEAATKAWQHSPRKDGEDLFSIAGVVIPEHLTRPKTCFVTAEELESDEEDSFEKVSSNFATVNDAYEDAIIKMRKAAQASSAAEGKMRMVDEARKRAKGNLSIFLRDIAD